MLTNVLMDRARGMTANRFHTLDTTVDVHDSMPFTAPA
jgi:hypothetical protein